MTNRQVLVIRHLPPDLEDADKEDLLRHFGASSVKIVTCKKKPIAFAKFDSEAKARNVLFRLHQLDVLGSRLIVEYAKESVNLADPRIDKISVKAEKTESDKEYYKGFITKLNAWNSSVDFCQPPPPHLKYLYPRANVATINNIAHALASVPKFYTQVLHLMNKMNLPPPFSNIPDPPELQIHQNEPVSVPEKTLKSSSESELESDPEEKQLNEENVPVKRLLPQNKKSVKRPKFIKLSQGNVGAQRSAQNPEDAFEKSDLEVAQKKIEVKVTSDSVESIKKSNQDVHVEGDNYFAKIKPSKSASNAAALSDDETVSESEPTKSNVISERELAMNRISEKDYDHLPVFKNYHAGVPSCRLYIKNLSKTITVDDLNYIYKRYLDLSSDQIDMFDIRLMQEGRMKGQAFVTLQNIELAQKALKETNGYILKDRPIVVVFARSAKPKQ